MSFSRWRRHGDAAPSPPAGEAADAGADDAGPAIDRAQLANLFEAPVWLRRLGIQAWLLVGVAVLLVGLVWILGLTATIVMPVVTGGVIAAVASPGVAALQRRGVPRIGGAAVILLALMGVAVVVIALVLGGIVAQSSEIKSSASHALDTIEGWLNDAGTGSAGTADAKQEVSSAVTSSGGALLKGISNGIQELASLAFFLSFTAFSLFFLLKDGPTIRRWANRHLGVPVPLADVITGRVVESLRHYFLGVTIVAAFNGVVVWLGALILGVPLAGTIGIVTFAAAYVPFIGRVRLGRVRGRPDPRVAGDEGRADHDRDRAARERAAPEHPPAGGVRRDPQPEPARRPRADDRRRVPLRHGRDDPRGPLASAAVHVSGDLARAREGVPASPRPGLEGAEAEQPTTG